jgi:pimeloyl-ACP methyl ester carboxylesterase
MESNQGLDFSFEHDLVRKPVFTFRDHAPRPLRLSWSVFDMTGGGRDGRSIFVTAQDGLRLHVQDYGSRTAPGVPVVCLPGLTRTVSDFDALAPALANDIALPHRVIAIDSRGRGRSDYDSNPDNYNLAVELADVATVLTALGVRPAVFIGSSRGGLLTMLMGVAHPTAIAGVVLHDIGPVIELKGLVRLKSYVGKLPTPRSFADGAEILRRLFAAQFPVVTAEGWLAAAHRTWFMKDDALTPTYDVRLARTLADIDIERPLPPLWNEFDSLVRVPMLVIHGANSDILSAATVEAMAAHLLGIDSLEHMAHLADLGRRHQHGRGELFIGCRQMLDPFPIALEWFFAVRSKFWRARRCAFEIKCKECGSNRKGQATFYTTVRKSICSSRDT